MSDRLDGLISVSVKKSSFAQKSSESSTAPKLKRIVVFVVRVSRDSCVLVSNLPIFRYFCRYSACPTEIPKRNGFSTISMNARSFYRFFTDFR